MRGVGTLNISLAVGWSGKPTSGDRHGFNRIAASAIRPTIAMHLLQSGVEISVIALWLGHESPTTTHMYVGAELAIKNRALTRLQQPDSTICRHRVADSPLALLKTLRL